LRHGIDFSHSFEGVGHARDLLRSTLAGNALDGTGGVYACAARRLRG
jgi:hypothetical protein